jgi:glycerol kinase
VTTHILALDQGTTSSRSMLFDAQGKLVAVAQREFTQYFPRSGWVEHDAGEIWATQAATIAEVLTRAGLSAADIAAIGITNQRETTVLWDRSTGRPVAPALVWQDRRTADACAVLEAAGHAAEVTRRTGLVLALTFRPPSSAGYSTATPRFARGRSAASSLSARLTAGSSGISPAARRT